MEFRHRLFILAIFILFSSLVVVAADENQFVVHDINEILMDNAVEDMTGCCSVFYQEDGASAMMAFRRDAKSMDDIYIDQVKWHGKDAIKQYKTTGEYFCQVVITSDGWMIGYGGTDDGPDNELIENITGEMIEKHNSITEDGLARIEEIKKPYKIGHVVIKAPNGDYGLATDKGHFTGKLKPGDYISMPNRYSYFRSGNLTFNDSSDKVKTMNELAISDGFGITRRDVTVFDFNATNEANTTDMYISNDDGSMHGMACRDMYDNVHFNGTTINGEDIPIAPTYKKIGTISYDNNYTDTSSMSYKISTILIYTGAAILVAMVIFGSHYLIKKLKRNGPGVAGRIVKGAKSVKMPQKPKFSNSPKRPRYSNTQRKPRFSNAPKMPKFSRRPKQPRSQKRSEPARLAKRSEPARLGKRPESSGFDLRRKR
jgi:hypothetical protein